MWILSLALMLVAILDLRKFIKTLKTQPVPDSILYWFMKRLQPPYFVVLFFYIGLIVPYFNLWFLPALVCVTLLHKLFSFLEHYVEKISFKKEN